MKRPASFFWFFARVLLGALFAYAGFSKLMEPMENFRAVLAQYTAIPALLTPLIARILPWFEFIIGTFLLLGYAPRLSALLLALMAVGFLAVVGVSRVLSGAFPADCGCFGQGGLKLSVPQMVFLDLTAILLGLGLFSLREHSWSLDQWLSRKRGH